MQKSDNIWIKVIRWIGILPALIISYVLAKYLFGILFKVTIETFLGLALSNFEGIDYSMGNTVNDIKYASGFGGHYILGPIFVFLREAIAVTLSFCLAIYITPNGKRIVFYFFLGLLIMLNVYLLISSIRLIDSYTTEMIIRSVIEFAALIVGLLFAHAYMQDLVEFQKS